MQTLAEIQRRLWHLISAPDGVAAALAAESGGSARALSEWIVDDAQLAAVRRLDVYAHAYFQRIHDCLARDFAASAATIGEAGFHDLVTAYLIAHPSRHPSLRLVGEALPGYLAGAQQAAPFRRRWPWLADLARLEWSLGCAFDAADAAPLTREDLAHAAGERWDELVLDFHSAVAHVGTAWPVYELYAGWCADRELVLPAQPSPQSLLVWRHEESVRHRQLDALETVLLRAALDDTPFGELCVLAESSGAGAEAAALTAACLGGWVDAGLLVAAETRS